MKLKEFNDQISIAIKQLSIDSELGISASILSDLLCQQLLVLNNILVQIEKDKK